MLRLVMVGSTFFPTLLASYGFKDLLPFGLSISEAPSNPFIRNHSELICTQHEFELVSSAEKMEFKRGERLVDPSPGQLQRFQDGFVKSTCFPDTVKWDMEELCIFVNPTTNNGKGMVVIASENLLSKSYDHGLKLTGDAVDPEAMKVVQMPEKGGMGSVASRKLQMGDPVVLERRVGLFLVDGEFWKTTLGMKICRQAIDHLPIHTRAAIARFHGNGDTEDEFLADVIAKNVFATTLSGDPDIVYGALVLDGSPNVVYFMDQNTQLFRMNAIEPIEAGTELTDTYRALTMSRDERHESLKKTYGFDCTCPICQMSKEEAMISDERIERLELLLGENINSTDEIQEMLQLSEVENIPWHKMYAHYYAAQSYNSQGKRRKVQEHAKFAKKLALILAGPNWEGFDDLEILIEAPEYHYSHFSMT